MRDLGNGELKLDLFSSVQGLSHTVKSDMAGLQVADALDAIVNVLQEVGKSYRLTISVD